MKVKKSNDFLSPEVRQTINDLKGCFVYNKNRLIYSERTQEKVSEYLLKLCDLVGYFDKSIKKEREAIKSELYYIDENGEKVDLVNIESMKSRVRSVLEDNTMFTCLKSLALVNKCAHVFDDVIDSKSDSICAYTNYGNKISFLNPIESVFKNINKNNLYNLSNISNFNDFLKDLDSIRKNISGARKKQKIGILNALNIKCNYIDDKDIDEKIKKIDRDKLINSYVNRAYGEGEELAKLQSKLFAIKDYYICMIGQLLKTKFKNVNYEIIETNDGVPGFKHMLIIDDRELSYYVEVHMPDYIFNKLVNDVGLKYSSSRKTAHASNGSIYKRDRGEVSKIFKKLVKGKSDPLPRARVITRGHQEEEHEFDDQLKQVQGNLKFKKKEKYTFDTKRLVEDPLLIESFLMDNGNYDKFIEDNRMILHNENYPIKGSYNMLCEKYYNLFLTFSHKSKKEFIKYSFSKLKNGDEFDKALYSCKILNDYYDDRFLDSIGKIMINRNILKTNYNQYKYKYNLNEYIKNAVIMVFDKSYDKNNNIENNQIKSNSSDYTNYGEDKKFDKSHDNRETLNKDSSHIRYDLSDSTKTDDVKSFDKNYDNGEDLDNGKGNSR